MARVTEIKIDLQRKQASLRSLIRTLDTPKFNTLYEGATPEDKEYLHAVIASGDSDQLSTWMKDQKENVSVRDLRRLAAKQGIRDYTRLSKTGLMRELQSC